MSATPYVTFLDYKLPTGQVVPIWVHYTWTSDMGSFRMRVDRVQRAMQNDDKPVDISTSILGRYIMRALEREQNLPSEAMPRERASVICGQYDAWDGRTS